MNTYEGNSGRGLSKLQKAILVWLYQQAEADQGYAKRGVHWRSRPQFYGAPFHGMIKHGSRFGYNETITVSRALKRLEQRGLVRRITDYFLDEEDNHLDLYPVTGGRTRYVLLTDRGKLIAAELVEAGVTSAYKDLHDKTMHEFHAWAREFKASRQG